MVLFINAETYKEIFNIDDTTTFDVESQINNDGTTIQIVASTKDTDPIVMIEYKFDKNKDENDQEYLDDMSEITDCVKILATDIKKMVDYAKEHYSTSKNSYVINISNYITEEGFFCVDYRIDIKTVKLIEGTGSGREFIIFS